jgi:hypothetical protein
MHYFRYHYNINIAGQYGNSSTSLINALCVAVAENQGNGAIKKAVLSELKFPSFYSKKH